MSSSNWQSFSHFCNKPQRAKMVPCVARMRWRRCEVRSDHILLWVEGPKAHTQDPEAFQVFECSSAVVNMKHGNWHVCKKTISACLLQSFAPVGNLQFKGSKNVRHTGSEILGRMIGGLPSSGRSFPGQRDNIGNSVTIRRNLASKRHRVSLTMVRERVESGPVCPGESKGEPILRASPRIELRKIPLRLVPRRFANRRVFHGLNSFRPPDHIGPDGLGLSTSPKSGPVEET